MEHLKINAGQAKATLAELLRLIQERKDALLRGQPPRGLANDLEVWETMLEQLRAELLLEKSAQISTLYEVSHVINASLDWRQTLQAVMDAVIHITEAERAMLLTIDDIGGMEVAITSSLSNEAFSESDLRLSYTVVEQALQRGRPILTTNAQGDPRFRDSESIVAYGLRSILCAPLIHEGEPLGVIYIDNSARTGVFTPEDLAMLAAFAKQAAVAVAHAYEHQKTDQQLTERIRELTILQEMARDLNTRLRFDRVMERSISWAVAAASAEGGAIALVAEEGVRWSAVLGDVEPDTAFAIQSVAGRAPIFERGRFALPLLREGRPIGVIYLEAKGHELSDHKLEFVTRVADTAAIAVENARLYEALRQASQAKSEFVSLVSHELRTPMTSIAGYADMLAQNMVGDLTPKQREFVDTIRRNSKRMRVLVSDLLDISRIETGRLELDPKPTSISNAIDEATKTVEEMVHEKEQHLSVDLPPDLPKVRADADRLTQILINLLSNAIKYTPKEGAIRVQASMMDPECEFLRCSVTDTGIGISPEDRLHLFTKFFRADSPQVREEAGTGLGLAISRSLVEMHGGRIWVESTPGEGTTFYFTMPVAQ